MHKFYVIIEYNGQPIKIKVIDDTNYKDAPETFHHKQGEIYFYVSEDSYLPPLENVGINDGYIVISQNGENVVSLDWISNDVNRIFDGYHKYKKVMRNIKINEIIRC